MVLQLFLSFGFYEKKGGLSDAILLIMMIKGSLTNP